MAHRLASLADAEAMLAASQQQPVLLLKHSSTCPVSALAQRRVRRARRRRRRAAVLPRRRCSAPGDVSAHLADALDVRHETPQALLIDAGTAVFAASHGRVRTAALRAAVRATPA